MENRMTDDYKRGYQAGYHAGMRERDRRANTNPAITAMEQRVLNAATLEAARRYHEQLDRLRAKHGIES